MKKSIIAILIIVAAVGFLFFIFKGNGQSSMVRVSNSQVSENKNDTGNQPAEKIEIVHFHATQQCWSCITVGKYALKTIKEKFPEEHENGTIVFMDINGDLPENRNMVIKYQARGSSLFINSIINGKDNIEEDINVWRLVSNEIKYINYLQNKINKTLGK